MPAGATEAYETLRRRVVQPDGGIEHAAASGTLIRCGLARWAQMQLCPTTAWSPPDAHPRSAYSPAEARPAWEVELIQVVASLILSIRQEGIRA